MTPQEREDLLRKAQEEYDALDPLDTPASWTQRQRDDFDARRAAAFARVTTLRNAHFVLNHVEPEIEVLTRFRDHALQWRTELEQRFAALPMDPRTNLEIAERDKLRLSLKWLMVGLQWGPQSECLYSRLPLEDLMEAGGYDRTSFLGPLNYVEERLRKLTEQRDDALYRIEHSASPAAAAT